MRDPVELFREHLRSKNMRCTQERDEIVRALSKTKKHFRIEDLVTDLKAKGSAASRATVYRTIPLLIESRMIRVAESNPGEESAYEYIYGRGHHDHLYCTRCNAHIEFEERGIEMLQMDVARHYGYKLVGHRLELYGVCPQCREKGAREL